MFTEGSGFSFLSIPGAKEVGAEFFSLSKSFNLTGARLSFFVGNRELVSALSLLRSQLDFGIFLPLQLAAVEALRVPRQYVLDQCQEYRKRRDALCNGLREAGWPVEDSQGTMFVFAKLPKRWEGCSAAFCEALVDACGVVCTPGAAFGSLGRGVCALCPGAPAPGAGPDCPIYRGQRAAGLKAVPCSGLSLVRNPFNQTAWLWPKWTRAFLMGKTAFWGNNSGWCGAAAATSF